MVQGLAIRVGENYSLEKHANPQIDWSPELFLSSQQILFQTQGEIESCCVFDGCRMAVVGGHVHLDSLDDEAYIELPMSIVPSSELVALHLHLTVTNDCMIFLEVMRDRQRAYAREGAIGIPLHQGENKIYKIFLAHHLSGFFRLRLPADFGSIELMNIELRGIQAN
jgi:hypothetical protein